MEKFDYGNKETTDLNRESLEKAKNYFHKCATEDVPVFPPLTTGLRDRE